jgi:hypothetical protein
MLRMAAQKTLPLEFFLEGTCRTMHLLGPRRCFGVRGGLPAVLSGAWMDQAREHDGWYPAGPPFVVLGHNQDVGQAIGTGILVHN